MAKVRAPEPEPMLVPVLVLRVRCIGLCGAKDTQQ